MTCVATGGDVQAKLPADFSPRFQGRKARCVAHSPRRFSPNSIVPAAFAKKRGNVALIFGEPVGDLQTERYGFGMDAVGAARFGACGGTRVRGTSRNFAENDQVALDNVRSVADEGALVRCPQRRWKSGRSGARRARLGSPMDSPTAMVKGDDVVLDPGIRSR